MPRGRNPKSLANLGGAKANRKGSRNKINSTVAQLCAERGFDPHEALIELATSKDTDIKIKADATKTLCRYVRPELKSIEMQLKGEVTLNNVQAIDKAAQAAKNAVAVAAGADIGDSTAQNEKNEMPPDDGSSGITEI